MSGFGLAPTEPPAPPEAPTKRKPWPFIVGGLVVALVAVGGIVVLSLNSSSTPDSVGTAATPNSDAKATVAAAAQKTLASRSFNFILSGGFNAEGQSGIISGGGGVDIPHKASQAYFTVARATDPSNVLGQINELFEKDTLYVGSNSVASGLPAGIRYLSVNLATAPNLGASAGVPVGNTSASSDPEPYLQALTSRLNGISVSELGKGSANGVAVERYRVMISTSDVNHSLTTAKIDPVMKSRTKSIFGGGDQSSVVAVDADGIVRQIDFDTSLNGATVLTGTIVMDLSDLGSKQYIFPPKPSETEPLADVTSRGSVS